MKKLLFAIFLAGSVALAAACLFGRPAPQAHALALTATPSPSPAIPEPDIPALVDKLYFGVPAGNGFGPQRVAIDSQRRRAYTLNYGLSARKEGDTLSVVDLPTGRVTALLKLGDMGQDDKSFSPTPMDLQVDPYRPRLYARVGRSLRRPDRHPPDRHRHRGADGHRGADRRRGGRSRP